MRNGSGWMVLPAVAALAASALHAAGGQSGLKVLSRPGETWKTPGKSFEPYELQFQLPKRLKANTDYESALFYAVVLLRQGSGECDGGEFTTKIEAVRKEAQKLFPDRKVFADHQCPDMGTVAYTVDGKPNNQVLVAVYAGETAAAAQPVLAKTKGKYPSAALRKMRVGFNRIVQ